MSCDATPPAAPMPTHPAPDPIGRRATPQRASRMLRGVALATLAVGAVGGCELRRVPDGAWRLRQLATRSAATQAPLAAVPPRVYALDAEALARAKRRIESRDPRIQPAYDQLLREASAALLVPAPSVMDKRRVPPSGDKHDYVSMGPYWWPDSTKPGGVPYIRRDGERNPEIRVDYDAPRLAAMINAVTTLSLAYYFSDDEEYAGRARLLLRTWFLDPATRMNPHLRYGQGIPGVTQGRAAGIIETRGLVGVVDAIGMLERSPSWTAADERGMAQWLSAYLGWLRSSAIGRQERGAHNNHGTWYDAQVAALALLTGDTALARSTLAAAKTHRIASQVMADGRQPYELARTRSLAYSVMNLEGLFRLAQLGRHVGVDLWSYRSPRGGSIRKALDYLAPYADPRRKWPGHQITPTEPDLLVSALEQARLAYHDARYDALLRQIPEDAVRAHRALLLYPEPDSLAAASHAGS